MRYVITIVSLILLGAGALVAQGEAHSIQGTIRNSDSSIPSADCLRFCAVYNTDSLCFPDDSGAGVGTRYLESVGVWLVQTSSFDPSPGDGEEISISFWNECIHEGASIEVTIDMGTPSQSGGLVVLSEMWLAEGNMPRNRSLSVFPNPFNASCTIVAEGDVDIYDISGKHIRTLHILRDAVWDGRDEAGYSLPAGVYLIKDYNSGCLARALMLK